MLWRYWQFLMQILHTFVSYSVPYYMAFQQMTYTYSCIDFSLRFNLQAELIDPALKGTLNVLASCKKFSIERVVVTSSMAAIAYNGKPRTPDVVVDERWFSSPEFCKQQKVIHSNNLLQYLCAIDFNFSTPSIRTPFIIV